MTEGGNGKANGITVIPPNHHLSLQAVQGRAKQGQNTMLMEEGCFCLFMKQREEQKFAGKLGRLWTVFMDMNFVFLIVKFFTPSLYHFPLEYYSFTPPYFTLLTGVRKILPPHFILYPWSCSKRSDKGWHSDKYS